MFLLFVYVFLALLFSFLCSIAEAVLLSITPSYIEKLKKTNPQKAARVKRLRFENVDRSLAAILTLNTIAHTVGAIVAGAKATHVFGDAWIGVFSGVITILILVFSEIIPKTIGAVYWKSLTGSVVTFVDWLIKGLYPLILLSEMITKMISKGKSHHMFNRDEFIAMAGLGQRSGMIDEQESRIINNLFKLSSVKAKDIMTPRSVVTSLPQDLPVEGALELLKTARFSRIPVYQDSMDDSDGFVLKSDVLLAHANGDDVTLKELKREISVVIEELNLTQLMESLMDDAQHIALVVTEYGDISGLVTLEDVIETLIGLEIVDELDQVQDMQAYARKQWLKRAASRGMVVDENLQSDK
ncbi:hemolysin family protein [Marinicella sp. S1101]|uniref:hemolysin family protein n=1 Tax=Marinicella marina TaxID=2996016 RepID=UPI002260D82D|nr:hemolysin family protein [Marinicella marina]MCX7552818.1 hemolysin family protein [Marinicella marina]MDJ1139873.1 hemolysin family protein [Marinicella marina]